MERPEPQVQPSMNFVLSICFGMGCLRHGNHIEELQNIPDHIEGQEPTARPIVNRLKPELRDFTIKGMMSDPPLDAFMGSMGELEG